MKVVGRDRESIRRDIIEAGGQIDHDREARLTRHRDHRVAFGRVDRFANSRDQHPRGDDVFRDTFGDGRAIDVREDRLAKRLERRLVDFKIASAFHVRRRERFAILRGVPADAFGQEHTQTALVPAEIGGGGFEDHEVGREWPRGAAEVLPALAGRMAGHGEIEDLDICERGFQQRFKAKSVVHAPSCADGVADDADAIGIRKFLHIIRSVAHAEDVGRPRSAAMGGVDVRLEDVFAQVINDITQSSRIEWGRHRRSRVKTTRIEDALIITALDAFGVVAVRLIVAQGPHERMRREAESQQSGGCGE